MSRSPRLEGETLAQENETLPLYLAQFDKWTVKLSLSDNTQPDVELAGEILIAGQRDTEGQLIVQQIRRLSLWTEPIKELEGPLALAGPDNKLEFAPASTHNLAPFDVRIYYPLLSKQEPACSEDDASYPQLETLRGQLFWRSISTPADAKIAQLQLTLTLDQLIVEVKESGRVRGLLFDTKDQPLLFRLLEEALPSGAPANSLQTCTGNPPGSSAGNSHEQRVLNLRFVSLSASPRTPAQIKKIAQDQITGACDVWWMKGGVRIAPQPNIVFPANPVVVGQVAFGQYNLLQTIDNDLNAVEVFLVDGLTDQNGKPIGGVTQNCYTQGAFVIITLDEAGNNDFLLAHELGHVLGLRHPNEPAPPPGALCQSILEGAPCSVMVPDSPDSKRNTLANLIVIEQSNNPLGPLFTSLGQLGGWNADQPQGFFHIIRDFPYDDGVEPSNPLPHFAVRWSHSDVWNSSKNIKQFFPELYDDSTPIFGPNFAPVHSNPIWNGLNRMYVRMHTCQQLAKPVDVHLFLAIPGAASAPLTALTTGGPLVFSNSDSSLPSPGRYPVGAKIKTLAWSVPVGYPAHCCVFAVADSTAQGANTPAKQKLNQIQANIGGTNFWTLASILATSNDVAQRNLQIEPLPKRLQRPLWLPWMAMSNPLEGLAAARLQIDAPAAPELVWLALEVDDKIIHEWTPGKPEVVTVAEQLPPGVDLIVRLVVRLVDEPPADLAIPIDVGFIIGEQQVAGYRHLLLAAEAEEVTARTLDALSGALRDVEAAFSVEEAMLMARSVRRSAARYRESPAQILGSLRRQAGRLAAIAGRLDASAAPDAAVTQRRLHELIGLLMTWQASRDPAPFLARIRELADRVQEQSSRAIRRSLKRM